MTEGSLHRQKWKAAIRLFFRNSPSVLAGSSGHATFALEKASNTPTGCHEDDGDVAGTKMAIIKGNNGIFP